MGKKGDANHYKAPPPPFKGAGGARVCWGRDDGGEFGAREESEKEREERERERG
jgi:hypothetical protein